MLSMQREFIFVQSNGIYFSVWAQHRKSDLSFLKDRNTDEDVEVKRTKWNPESFDLNDIFLPFPTQSMKR